MPSKSRHGLLQFVSFQPVHELHVAFHRPVLFKYGEILAEEHVPHSAVDGIRYPLRSSRKRKRISWLALNFMSADVLVAFRGLRDEKVASFRSSKGPLSRAEGSSGKRIETRPRPYYSRSE